MRIRAGKARKGFTLLELAVTIGILGTLAAIAVPLVTNHLGAAEGRSWGEDQRIIQNAVDVYRDTVGSDPQVKFKGDAQYPIRGMDATGPLKPWNDADSSTDLTSPGNPFRGTRGGEPKWRDNGDTFRTEENLNAESLTNSGTGSGWYVFKVNVQGTEYVVDTRNFFIDFNKLTRNEPPTAKKLLKKVPSSASRDNLPGITQGATASGSYSWYVDADGVVNAIFYPRPTNGTGPGTNNGSDNRGFITEIYP